MIFFISISSFSQNTKIDSLKNELKKKIADTLKVENLSAIAGCFWNKDWDSARHYTKKSYSLAIKINDKRGIIMNIFNMATYEEISGNFKKANEIYLDGYKRLRESKDDRLLASYYYNYGNLNKAEGKTDLAIENYNMAIILFKKFKKNKTVAKINDNIALIYIAKSNFREANNIYFKNLDIYIKEKDYIAESGAYNNIGYTFSCLKDFEKAIFYFNKSLKLSIKYNIKEIEAESYLNLACGFGEQQKYTKAENYFNLAKHKFKLASYEQGKLKCDINLCELFIKKREYKKANVIVNSINFSEIENVNDYINANKIKGICLLIENKSANKFLKEAYDVTLQAKLNQQLPEILSLLLEDNFKSKKNLTGLKYFNEYDSIVKIQNNLENKQSNFILDVKYRTAEKESQIKTQQLQIEQEKTNKYMAFGGIGFLVLLSSGGFLWFKNQQKQKELLTQNTLFGLQHNINSMELQNLNQQLNPHEIKNLLASISPEIQEKAPESYKKMLKLFNLTKASLNSNSITDSVENQVQQIEGFLSLEKNMLSEPLKYTIDNKIESHQAQIPRLLLKNLVENAIKHGIKGQENGGEIKVILQENNGFIHIEIDDTGKGRQHAILLDTGIGTSTYQKLFATLNPKNKENATFEIIDKEQGTKVEVKIPVDYKYS